MNVAQRQKDLLSSAVSRALRALEAQRNIPLSPGQMDGDSVLLCAGAAFVKEAVALLRAPEYAEKFTRDVVWRDSEFISRIGCTIGLDERMVNEIVIVNDKLPGHDRLAGTHLHLSRIASV